MVQPKEWANTVCELLKILWVSKFKLHISNFDASVSLHCTTGTTGLYINPHPQVPPPLLEKGGVTRGGKPLWGSLTSDRGVTRGGKTIGGKPGDVG